jgi:hypothetical protein
VISLGDFDGRRHEDASGRAELLRLPRNKGQVLAGVLDGFDWDTCLQRPIPIDP